MAIVSEWRSHAATSPNRSIGRRIGDNEFTAEIVGVVGDVRPYSLRDSPVAMVYFPIRQWPSEPRNLAVHVTGDVSGAVSSVRAALERAEPGLVLDTVTTMAQQLERNVLRERLVTYLAAAFAALSLLLGCVGCTRCIRIRSLAARRSLACGWRSGASPRDLRQAVFGDTLRVTVAGTGAGLIAAFWASGFPRALLFEVSSFDPVVAILFRRVVDRHDPRGQLPSCSACRADRSAGCAAAGIEHS